MMRCKCATWTWVVVVLGALLATGSALAEERSLNANRQGPKDSDSLFEGVTLPYEGNGSIVVLNNGLLEVEIRDQTTCELCGRVEFHQKKSFFFAPDIEGLTLVEADGEWFLDANGATIQARGLSTAEVSQISFDEGAAPEYQSARESLLSIEAGHMLLEFAPESRTYHLEIRDSEGTRGTEEATEFSVTFGPVLAPTGGSCTGSCSCSASCPNETECSVSCLNRCCLCYCKDKSVAVCKCINKPPDSIVLP